MVNCIIVENIRNEFLNRNRLVIDQKLKNEERCKTVFCISIFYTQFLFNFFKRA